MICQIYDVGLVGQNRSDDRPPQVTLPKLNAIYRQRYFTAASPKQLIPYLDGLRHRDEREHLTDMDSVLFVHNNFPAQFGFVADAMRREGWRGAAIGSRTARPVADIPLLRWKAQRSPTRGILQEATRAEADLIRARAAAECALKLKKSGFRPRLIIGHPGWGETIYLREIFPEAKQIIYGEFYYRSSGADVGFDAEFGGPLPALSTIQSKNASVMLAYSEADRIVAPTPFQASLLPNLLKDRTVIIHDGVDTGLARPNAVATLLLPGRPALDRSRPVITFINRTFEPMRGYHIFMRALPMLLSEVPEAEIVLIGGGKLHGYGLDAPAGTTWKEHFLDEVGDSVDRSRLHFTGFVPYRTLLDALCISAAHVYFTYPFVLSWSLLDAMACECLIVGSDTPPVRDLIKDGENGILLPFFDPPALARQLVQACREPERFAPLRKKARETVVAGYDRRRISQPAWLKLVSDVLKETL